MRKKKAENVLSASACRKSSPLAIFSDKTGFHCTFGVAVKTCKETLLRKASDLTAHVAEVGLAVGGLRPSDTSHGVYRQSGRPNRGHFVTTVGAEALFQ